jgi:RNA polymerase sigma factor (sigma-70 family)
MERKTTTTQQPEKPHAACCGVTKPSAGSPSTGAESGPVPATSDHVAGSRTALVATLIGQRARFLGFLERRIGDRALAEDVLQEAYARLDKLDHLRDGASAVAWFYRVLRNAATDRARRTRAQLRGLEAFAAELDTHEATAGEPAHHVCRCVAGVKDALKPAYREALERIELDGVAVKDYADELGITPGNAAVRVYRARDALRRELARTCGRCAELGCVDCSCESGPDQTAAD